MPQVEVHRTSDPAGLRQVAGKLHDAWFDLDEVAHIREDERVVIPMAHTPAHRPPRGPIRPELTLVIRNVLSITLCDEAQIGRYDVADLAYSSDSSTVSVLSAFPLRLELRVRSLDVQVLASLRR